MRRITSMRMTGLMADSRLRSMASTMMEAGNSSALRNIDRNSRPVCPALPRLALIA